MAIGDGGTLSASDIALLTNNGGFGNGGDAIWVLLLLMFGFNGNGLFGNNRNGADGINPNYVTNADSSFISRQIDSDTASLERKLDYVQEQICTSDSMRANQIAGINENLFTMQNNNAVQFAGVNQGISNNRYETQIAVSNAQNGIQNAINALSAQQAQCCCDNRVQAIENSNMLARQLADMNYNNAMNANTANQVACNNTRDIIENSNANFRALHDEIVANRMADKDAQISQLQTALNNATLSASQARQTNQIVDALRVPTPVPAFNVPMPWSYNGMNNGCGCNGF